MSSTSMPPPDNTHPTTQPFLQRNDMREQNATDANESLNMRRGGSGKYKKRKTNNSKKSRKHSKSRRLSRSRRPKSSRRYRKSRK